MAVPNNNLKSGEMNEDKNFLAAAEQKSASILDQIPVPVFEKKQQSPEPARELTPVRIKEQEKALEKETPPAESGQGFLDETLKSLRKKLSGKKPQKTLAIPQVKDTITVKIEHILEEGLSDAYQELTPVQKQEFKIKGEETAWKIRNLLKDSHIKIKQIFRLLIEWLKMLPGINRFFLEQEAKIKADRIIALKQQK